MIHIEPIPAFQDNYIWLIHDSIYAVAVDPGDGRPVLKHLESNRLQLAAILVTHHHSDHVGGIASLVARFPVPVYGPKSEPIASVTHPLSEGDQVLIPAPKLRLTVLEIPGHTAGHIGYYGANRLFCGDTLFGCGCGRLFEGTPNQMLASLTRLAKLPDQTQVYCAHEYTLENIRFARMVDPDNPTLLQRQAEDSAARKAGRPTLPSTIGRERQTNPFLRCEEPALIRATGRDPAGPADPVAVFAALREAKNHF